MAYIYSDMAAVGRRLYTAINNSFVNEGDMVAMVLPLPAKWREEALQLVCNGQSDVALPEDSVRTRLRVMTLNGGSGAVRDLMAFLQANINPMELSYRDAEKLSDEALQPVADELGIPVGAPFGQRCIRITKVNAEVLLLVRAGEADEQAAPLPADVEAGLPQLCADIDERINARGGFEVLMHFDFPKGVSLSSLLANDAVQALLAKARVGNSWRICGNVQDGYTLSC